MKTKQKIMVLTLFLACMTLGVIAPVLAQGNGPKYEKVVSPLANGAGVGGGQVIYNVNPEDDGTFELEVEIEEYLPFAESTVEVKLDGVSLGTIVVDEYGSGKATFYVAAFAPDTNVVTIVFAYSMTPAMIALSTDTGIYHAWVKGPGPK